MRPRPHRYEATSAHIALLVLSTHCGRAGCAASTPSTVVADAPAATTPVSDRCHRELALGAVARVPGTGAIDTLLPACGPDGSLTVFALRGHTLSRLVRSREAGSVFAPPVTVSTGVDRLGPIGADDANGPLAWRSPTSSIDETERDAWWGATMSADGRVARGTVLLPAGEVGLGIVVPLAHDAAGVTALATVARPGRNPALIQRSIGFAERDAGAAMDLGEGELQAYEPVHRIALVRALDATGASELRALELPAHGAPIDRGRVPLEAEHALVVTRGVAHGETSVFAYATFAPVQSADAGGPPCIAVAPSLCVRAGPPMLLVAGREGIRTLALASTGLFDTIGLDAVGRVAALYIAPGVEGEPVQRAVGADPTTGRVEPLGLAPSDALPPLDHPAVVRCDGEPWLVAEVRIDPDDAERESALMAAPLACVLPTTGR